MSLLADRIEALILQKMLEEKAKEVIVQRKELADELNCAPSQITYVLTTRFSTARGYEVESRRGLGGFIRITRLKPVVTQQVQIRVATPPGRNRMEDKWKEFLLDILEERR